MDNLDFIEEYEKIAECLQNIQVRFVSQVISNFSPEDMLAFKF
jgi:hypothetical protein